MITNNLPPDVAAKVDWMREEAQRIADEVRHSPREMRTLEEALGDLDTLVGEVAGHNFDSDEEAAMSLLLFAIGFMCVDYCPRGTMLSFVAGRQLATDLAAARAARS